MVLNENSQNSVNVLVLGDKGYFDKWAGRSSKQNNRGRSLFSLLTSGKNRDNHTFKGEDLTPPDQGITATGGIINDYTEGGKIYVHISSLRLQLLR